MHELPITQSICTIVVEEAERLHAKKILKIRIKQGEYRDYIPEVIQEYFNLVSEGTLAEGAELVVDTVPAVLRCGDCAAESRGEHYRMRCPHCGSRNVTLLSGREFYIDSMEVEDGD